MEEQEIIEVGMYCTNLLSDPQFLKVISLTEQNLSLSMLQADTAEERESVHRKYQGLKEVVDLIKQFVVVKDQIAINEDKKEIE